MMKIDKARLGYVAAAALLISLCASGPSASAAGLVVGSNIRVNYANFPGTNGEFGVFVQDTSAHTGNGGYVGPATNTGLARGTEDFRTFCVERTGGQYIYNNEEVTVSAISTVTSLGVSLTNAAGMKAAWLFKEFTALRANSSSSSNFLYNGTFGAAGATVNYNGSSAHANALQDAIWFYVGGQATLAEVSTNQFYLAAENALNASLIAAGGLKGIRVLTLTGTLRNGTTARQDMLYDTGTEVPEPGTFVIFAVGLVGAAWRRRRDSAALMA